MQPVRQQRTNLTDSLEERGQCPECDELSAKENSLPLRFTWFHSPPLAYGLRSQPEVRTLLLLVGLGLVLVCVLVFWFRVAAWFVSLSLTSLSWL